MPFDVCRNISVHIVTLPRFVSHDVNKVMINMDVTLQIVFNTGRTYVDGQLWTGYVDYA
jgi:hypothetical protein